MMKCLKLSCIKISNPSAYYKRFVIVEYLEVQGNTKRNFPQRKFPPHPQNHLPTKKNPVHLHPEQSFDMPHTAFGHSPSSSVICLSSNYATK